MTWLFIYSTKAVRAWPPPRMTSISWNRPNICRMPAICCMPIRFEPRSPVMASRVEMSQSRLGAASAARMKGALMMLRRFTSALPNSATVSTVISALGG
jgi:hypothetical protein